MPLRSWTPEDPDRPGEAEEVGAKMAACKPAYFDVLPLSLEEIFIYELGGVDYEIKDILL